MSQGPTRRLAADKRAPAQPPAQPPRRQPRPSRRRGNVVVRGITGTVSLVWRILWGSVWRLGLTVALILGLASAYYFAQLPEASALFDGRARGSVTMLDHEGRVFAWRGETYGMVAANAIAPVLKEAVVATEDQRFYRHLGISPRGIAGAIRTNMAEGRGPLEGAGGSTITVQVAKLLCLGESFDPTRWKDEAAYEAECRQSSLWRKIKEVPFAFALEAKYSKDEILNIYMNRSYLGAGARGFEAAAQRYFNRPAAEVNAAQAAMLAGLLKAPSYFAPTNNLQRAQDRANLILGLMRDQGRIDETTFDEARANPATLSRAAAARDGGYFADWVMESGPGFLTSETTEDVTIRTTFDPRLQKAAEEALAQVFATKVKDNSAAEAAVVVMSADGAVRAMIGGRNKAADGSFNRATQAMRQVGSSFKPFVFAAALDQGYSPTDIVLDAPLTINVRGSGPWSPQNYTRAYKGEITLTSALAQSINTSTIRLQEAIGRDAVRRVAEGFGFANNLAQGPALGLGASESTLLEMTGAYAGIRNGGTAVRPYGLVELKIAGEGEALIGQSGGLAQRVISPQSAVNLMAMMREVITHGTGTRAKLPDGRDAAGKTGTTSSYRDAWFIGFTEQYITGVWMGYDDNTPLTGVTGGGLPAEIWQAVMAKIHEGLPMLPLGIGVPDSAGGIVVTPVPSIEGGDALAAALGAALGQHGLADAEAAPLPDGTVLAPVGDELPPGPDPLAELLAQQIAAGGGDPSIVAAPRTPGRVQTSDAEATPLPGGGGLAPRTPGNVQSSGPVVIAPQPAEGGSDPLADALKGILN